MRMEPTIFLLYSCQGLQLSASTIQRRHEPTFARRRAANMQYDELSIGDTERRIQWLLMKQNFGCRWEGQTRWFSPTDTQRLAADSQPLDSIYQLEFPRNEPSVGTWRGWGVIAAGDGPRIVPLSEATVIERQRQQGSTTFQFRGVGGRCSLRCDSGVWAGEINFFHGEVRAGLVVYLKAKEEAVDTPSGSVTTPKDASVTLMSMSFRRATISTDGNATFVDGNKPSRSHAHTFDGAPPANEWATAEVTSCVRREAMRADDYRIVDAIVDDAAAATRSPGAHKTDSWQGAAARHPELTGADATIAPSLLTASLPDGVRCVVPRAWPLDNSARLVFGCDFRPIGGPFRSLTMDYRDSKLEGWLCEDFVNTQRLQ